MTVPVPHAVRILAYSDSLYFSGAEAFFCRVVGALAQRSWCAVSCAAPAENQELVDELTRVCALARPVHVPAQPAKCAALFLYDPIRRFRVARVLNAHPWDVLLVNLPSVEYGSTPLLLDVAHRGRTLGLLHIHHRLDDVGFRLGHVRERLARRSIRRLDTLCVLSPWARALAVSSWVDEGLTEVQVVRAPRPRIVRLPQDAARTQLGLPLRERVIGIAGRISFRQKGHDTFIEAAELLLREGLQVRFAVAGEGRDSQVLENAVVSRGLAPYFHLLGSVRPIDPFLSAIDVLAIPSRFEGVPLIALEALQTRTPGVATAIDGLQQLWPAEWQVPADDPVALAAALRALISSPGISTEALTSAAERAESFVSDDAGVDIESALGSLLERDRAEQHESGRESMAQ